jgi:hypothetical protein
VVVFTQLLRQQACHTMVGVIMRVDYHTGIVGVNENLGSNRIGDNCIDRLYQVAPAIVNRAAVDSGDLCTACTIDLPQALEPMRWESSAVPTPVGQPQEVRLNPVANARPDRVASNRDKFACSINAIRG